MELINFLTNQRQQYIEALIMLFQRLEREGQQAFLEAIDELEHVEPGHTLEFSHFRYDILVKSDEEYYEVKGNINPSMFEKAKEYEQNSLEIFISSFVWNGCSISFSSLLLNIDLIKRWYLKWIRVDENNLGKELLGVIHNVSIESKKDGYQIVIDFGSAPIVALIELFSIFQKENVKKIFIGASSR